MRSNLEGAEIRGCGIFDRNRFGVGQQALAGNLTMNGGEPPILVLDTGGVARTILLPNEVKGQFFIIFNNSAGAFSLTVKDDSNTITVGTVAQGKCAMFFCDGQQTTATAGWHLLLGS